MNQTRHIETVEVGLPQNEWQNGSNSVLKQILFYFIFYCLMSTIVTFWFWFWSQQPTNNCKQPVKPVSTSVGVAGNKFNPTYQEPCWVDWLHHLLYNITLKHTLIWQYRYLRALPTVGLTAWHTDIRYRMPTAYQHLTTGSTIPSPMGYVRHPLCRKRQTEEPNRVEAGVVHT